MRLSFIWQPYKEVRMPDDMPDEILEEKLEQWKEKKKPLPCTLHAICGVTGKPIPPEDAGACNNADGCDNCPHNTPEEE
jgi:hypothetical protein